MSEDYAYLGDHHLDTAELLHEMELETEEEGFCCDFWFSFRNGFVLTMMFFQNFLDCGIDIFLFFINLKSFFKDLRFFST